MTNQKKAYLLALVSVLFWSTVASAFKISLRHLDFLQLLLYSSATSVFVLFLILVVQKKVHLLKESTPKHYLHSAILGCLNPFLYYIVLFKAYSLLPAQEAQPLNYTWPIMLSLLSIPLLKQRIRFRNILAILISFVGVFIISTEGKILQFHLTNTLGVCLALGSSVIWALFWIYNIRDQRDDVLKLFLNFSFGFIFILILIVFKSEFVLVPVQGLLGAVYVGIFEMGLVFILWLKALKYSHTTAQVSNLIYLSPFLSLLFIHFLVGERILISTIIGLVFIVCGIIIQQYRSQLSASSS
jgi:drug/metabolite transporter (DMT)-like permease